MSSFNIDSTQTLVAQAALVTGDTISLDANTNLTVQTADVVKLILQIDSMDENGEIMGDDLIRFLARLYNNEANILTAPSASTRELYVIDQNGNLLLMSLLNNSNKVAAANEKFLNSKVKLESSNQVLVGMLCKAGDLVVSRNTDMGFYVKGVNSSYVITSTPTTRFTVTTMNVSSNIEFTRKFVNLMDDSVDYFRRPNNFIVNKNADGSFDLILVNTGLFLLLEANKPIEYAINQLLHSQDKSNLSRPEVRSARRLYNNNLAPTKGRYNGWALDPLATDGMNLNLYDATKDKAINGDVEYVWVQIYNPNASALNIKFLFTDSSNVKNTVSLATSGVVGRHIVWMSTTNVATPSKNQFNVMADTQDIVDDASSNNVVCKAFATWNLQADASDAFYLEAYGFQDQSSVFNLATRQIFDSRLPEENQVYLGNQQGYDMMQRRFIDRFIDASGSTYPMDMYDSSAVKSNASTDAQVEEKTHGSQGWYFDNNKSNMNLKLIENLNINYNDLHTLFVEVIAKSAASYTFNAYNHAKAATLSDKGHRIIAMKASPVASEGLTDMTLGPHFSTLNPLLPVDIVEIVPAGNGDFSFSVSDDVEIISFGYKKEGAIPCHWLCRWESVEVNPMSRIIPDYLELQKDAQIDLEKPEEVNDAMFSVRAYGNFVEASYCQVGNNYNNIKVDARLNKDAVEHAFYLLENCSLNNYTIDPTGLRYTADAVAIVDKNGVPVNKVNVNSQENNGVLINNMYIMADFQNAPGSVNSIAESTFITNQDTTKIFNKEGGLAPVVLEAIYAALFKEFNKSASITNNKICSSTRSTIYKQCNKPDAPEVAISSVDATVGVFQNSATYRYKITFSAAAGETEGSNSSMPVVQPITGHPKKIDITLPTSNTGGIVATHVKIYREKNMSGEFKLVATALLAAGSYTDNINDSALGAVVPTANTLNDSQPESGLQLSQSLERAVNEQAVDSEDSVLFKLYEASGRLEKDHAIYAADKRGGEGTKYDGPIVSLLGVPASPAPDALNNPDTISMNLENMELRFKVKLRGSIFDNGSGNLTFAKEALNKQLAELVFGKYNNGSLEPETLVRQVTRISAASSDNGVDEKGHIMTMLSSGNQEMQYEIVFKVTLVQKSVTA